MKRDGKYEGKNPLAKLHPGEPYFFLRAQDQDAPEAVLTYAETQERNGNHQAAQECRDFADRMTDWQTENPDLVKPAD